ncbi:MAG TPA: FMN-binding protein [bacterium]|nr:FMN-binding protein [bacterium]
MTSETRGLASVAAALLCFAVTGCGSRQAPKSVPVQNPVSQPAPVAPPVASPTVAATPPTIPAKSALAPPVPETVPTIVRKAFPAAASARRSPRPFPHQVIRDSAGQILGYEAFSDSAGVTAKGYEGAVPVQVFFDPHGKPVRIYILNNQESPAYIDLVSRGGLLEKLLAFDPAQPESVDAVTMATFSSRAIIAGVTDLAKLVASEIAVNPDAKSH